MPVVSMRPKKRHANFVFVNAMNLTTSITLVAFHHWTRALFDVRGRYSNCRIHGCWDRLGKLQMFSLDFYMVSVVLKKT